LSAALVVSSAACRPPPTARNRCVDRHQPPARRLHPLLARLLFDCCVVGRWSSVGVSFPPCRRHLRNHPLADFKG
jgi:hypothetical protein